MDIMDQIRNWDLYLMEYILWDYINSINWTLRIEYFRKLAIYEYNLN